MTAVVDTVGVQRPGRDSELGFISGTDEESILTLLTARSNAQRQEIAAAFKTLFGRVRRGFGGGPRAACVLRAGGKEPQENILRLMLATCLPLPSLPLS